MIRRKVPDKKNAQSLIDAAQKEVDFVLSLDVTEQSASTIIRNIYESFRMLGDAMLALEGVESKDHLMPIQRLMKVDVKTTRPLRVIDNLRKLRHNINYYGYIPKPIEAEDVISIANACFKPLKKSIQEKIKLQ